MTRLVDPDARLHASWAAAVIEFGETPMHGSGLWDLDMRPTEAGCRAAVAHLADIAPGGSTRDGREIVPCSYLWIVDGPVDAPAFVGYLALRHRLNDWLLEEGGHIGYSVRPSRRREGHASAALALGVRRAATLGIERVLVTCDVDNAGSARTIERCGGVLEDVRVGKRRYWIGSAQPRAVR